jgi:uncharacterized membrane protein
VKARLTLFALITALLLLAQVLAEGTIWPPT